MGMTTRDTRPVALDRERQRQREGEGEKEKERSEQRKENGRGRELGKGRGLERARERRAHERGRTRGRGHARTRLLECKKGDWHSGAVLRIATNCNTRHSKTQLHGVRLTECRKESVIQKWFFVVVDHTLLPAICHTTQSLSCILQRNTLQHTRCTKLTECRKESGI